MADQGQSFFGRVWAILKAIGHAFVMFVIAPLVALLVVAVGIALAALGYKELKIGGLLDKLIGALMDRLFGASPAVSPIDVANSIPADRVDPNGKLIPQGTPDSKGETQAVVVPIDTGGLFSDPNKVTVTVPGSEKPIDIQLPTGVTSKDVDKVIVLQPNQFVVTVKDSSGISAQQLDDVLKKYSS